MALMERKREKKAKPGAEKPAPQPGQPDPRHQPEPGTTDRAEQDRVEQGLPGQDASSQQPQQPQSPQPASAREPISMAELEPIPTTKERKVRMVPLVAAAREHAGQVPAADILPASNAIEMQRSFSNFSAATPAAILSPPGEILVESTTGGILIADELASIEYEDLTDIEKDVLRVARDSLKKKRFEVEISFEPLTPMVEKIVGDCLAKYQAQKGYAKDTIINTLKALEDQRWIVTAERRTKDEILGDDLYQDIIKFLESYPGTHARDERVQQQLGITRNPFLKHILVLDRFQLIQKRKFGKLWNFFALSFKEDEKIAELVVVLYNDIVRQLIRLLIKNPGATLVELARNIIPPVYHGAIQYHLKKLEELGFVINDGKNRSVNAGMLARYNAAVCAELRIES
jgi:predicted transcriptional regulator